MNVSDLATAISSELESYSREVDQKMQKEVDAISKEIVKELKNNPDIPVRTGNYKKSFYVKNSAKGMGYKRNIVANKEYQITHLLETRHLTSTGRRPRAFPHWAQAQKIADTLPERLKKVL